jgi:hypothetical protein
MMRKILGISALLSLTLAANLLVGTQLFRSAWLWGLVALGLIAGVAWLGITVVVVAGRARGEGRSAGGLNAVVSSLLFFGICAVSYAFI